MIRIVPKISKKDINRFWKKVDKKSENECWNWLSKLNRGYGWFFIKGYKNAHRAHRVSWTIHKGIIPKERLVLHKCDNRACVNPNHLFLGNYDLNNKDRVLKGRSSVGEDRPAHKLLEGQVIEIRKLYDTISIPYKELAKMFKVSIPNISIIVNRKGWKHI